jgi:hypothetical protein
VVADPAKNRHEFIAREDRKLLHELNGDGVEADLFGAVCLQKLLSFSFLENQIHHFTDVAQSLINGLALRVATLEERAFHNIIAIETFLDKHRQPSAEPELGLL